MLGNDDPISGGLPISGNPDDDAVTTAPSTIVGIRWIGTRFRRWWNPPVAETPNPLARKRRREEEVLAEITGRLP